MKKRIVILISTVVIVAAGVSIWLLTHSDDSTPKDQKVQQDKAPSVELNVPEGSLLTSQDKKTLQIAIKSDNYNKISRVEYLIDGTFVGYSTTAPFGYIIDLTSLSPGDHTLQAVAYDMSGKTIKSAIFTFTLTAGQPTEAANDQSQTIVRNSSSLDSLQKIAQRKKTTGSSGNNSGSNNNSGNDNNSGGNNGGGDGDTTPWPDTPAMAQICGNSVLNGPATAPANAIVVSAGNNSAVNLEQAGKTYWFAPGTHYLGNNALSQIEPADNSTYVGAPGAVLDGQGVNQYAFTQHAVNVKIQYMTITNFVGPRDEGVVNHDSGVGWTIEYNTMYNNKGGAVFAGTDNVLRYNCLRDNGQYGFQVYSSDVGGPHNVLIDHNEISGNNTDDWEAQITGCGCTGGGKFWEAHNVTVSNNYVHDNLSVGLWADTNDYDFVFEGNYISGNKSQGIFYEISYNAIIRNNNFIRNGLVDGPSNNSFPTGAIYLSEAGGDARVGGRTSQLEVYDNRFNDNWSGIILWENADRFCASPANTSSGVCTIVSPGVATIANCGDPASGGHVNTEPYKTDCRWKTQNVTVHNNIFDMTRANISGCTASSSCGYQGIFSNVGSFPSWSPYMGSGIQTAITFGQNNHFSSNTYTGDWNFKAKTQSTNMNFAIWQLSPYLQDVGSTFNGQNHLVIANALDSDTATLEGGLGKWTPWFSSSIAQTTEEAHTGTHSLKITITAAFGWGVELTSAPTGYPVTTINKTLSYWAKVGTGTNLATRMEVQWLDEDQNLLGTTVLPSSTLTSSWQQVSTTTTPPSGTASANIVFVNGSGSANNTIYVDDIVVGDN